MPCPGQSHCLAFRHVFRPDLFFAVYTVSVPNRVQAKGMQAEALFGVPPEIEAEVRLRLDPQMVEMLDAFSAVLQHCAPLPVRQ